MDQESIFEDGTVLLQSGAARQASGLDEIAALGADTVRALVFWRDVARSPDAKRVPSRRIDAAGFARYDALVRGAAERGLKVLLTPVGPIPRWASGCRRVPATQRGCKPSPRYYGEFVRALGERYPDVDRWSFWNEPNQAGWLSPQFVRRGGRVVNVAADRYRALARAGVAALRATGHASHELLLGETAPVGRQTGPLKIRAAPPVTFLKRLFRGPRLAVSGFAHHPYTMGAHDAPGARESPGQISFTSVAKLKRLLALGARRDAIPRDLPIWYTEFGYQSNPPDPRLGVPPALQAEYLNQADYVAARDPRIRSVAQYKLVDDQDQASFQTGLRRFGSLRRKLAYDAYRLPIWPVRRGAEVSVYGQLRPAVNGTDAYVAIQHARTARGPFETVQEITVSSERGTFLQRVPYRKGVWRLSYTPSAGTTLYSRVAAVR